MVYGESSSTEGGSDSEDASGSCLSSSHSLSSNDHSPEERSASEEEEGEGKPRPRRRLPISRASGGVARRVGVTHSSGARHRDRPLHELDSKIKYFTPEEVRLP